MRSKRLLAKLATATALSPILAGSLAGGMHAYAQDAATPFAITSSDVAPAGSAPATFAITADDVNAAAIAGRRLTYQNNETAGDAAITNNDGDVTEFIDQSSAAQATIVNNSGGATYFDDDASAGSAFITANDGSTVGFSGNSTAAGANFTINSGGVVSFSEDSDAGNAAIANNGDVSFADNATAAQSNIVNNAGASVAFSGQSSAGTGEITNNGAVTFSDSASAGQGLMVNNEGATIGFTGNSTAAGTAITNSGAVTFDDNATAGSASFVNNATGAITFDGQSTAGDAFLANSGELTFDGSSSGGTAELVNNATGVIVVSGQANLANAAVNNGGQLTFSGNSSAGSAVIVTGPNGSTIFTGESTGGLASLQTNAGGVVDFSGVTDGAFEVGSIQGPGTYYLGGVMVTVGANGQSTTVDGAIVDGGLSGGTGGGLTKVGAGTLTLSGANTYTGATIIQAGVLQAGAENTLSAASAFTVSTGALLDLAGFDQRIASLSGGGAVDLATATLTTGDASDTVFSGVITGTGGLVKVGTGRFELSGVSSYSGDTRIDAGELAVSGSIADSAVWVGAGATLRGGGTVGATTVAGTLARENDGATMTVNGDLTFDPGGTYQVTVDQNPSADLVHVDGTADLTDGALVIVPVGTFTALGSSFQILTASQIVGTFASVTTAMPFLAFEVLYGSNAVSLNVSRSSASFASVARTLNQTSVAEAVEAMAAGTVYEAVLNSASESAARYAFDALSGEIYPSVASAAFQGDRLLRDAVMMRATEGVWTGEASIWSQPFFTNLDLKSDGNAAALEARRAGIFAGADGALTDQWKLGVAAGFAQSGLDVADRASEATVTTLSVAAFSAWQVRQWRATVGGLASWHDIEAKRSIDIGAFSDRTEARYNALSGQVFGQAEYPFMLGEFEVPVFANLAYARWSGDAFQESGGDAALDVGKTQSDGFIGTVGVRFSRAFQFEGYSGRLGGLIGWRASSFDGNGAWMRLAGSDRFYIGGVPVDRNGAVLGLNASIDRGAMSFGFAYDGFVGADSIETNVRGFARMRF